MAGGQSAIFKGRTPAARARPRPSAPAGRPSPQGLFEGSISRYLPLALMSQDLGDVVLENPDAPWRQLDRLAQAGRRLAAAPSLLAIDDDALDPVAPAHRPLDRT